MKKIWFLFFVPICFLLTGCTSYTELNEIGIISSLGIEHKDDHYFVSATFVLPEKEQGESAYALEVITQEGRELEDVIHHIAMESGKKVKLSHLSYLIIDEEVASSYLDEVFQFFLQDEESRNNFPMVVSRNSRPSEWLEKSTDVNDIPLLFDVNQMEYATTLSLSLEDIIKMQLTSDVIIVPVLAQSEEEKTTSLAAIHNKRIFYLPEEICKGYLYLKNKVKQTILSVPMEDSSIFVSVLESYTSLSTKKNHLIIEIDSQIEANSRFSNEEIRNQYEETMRKIFYSFFEMMKKEQLDLLHLHTLIYQNDPRYYQQNQNTLIESFTYEVKFQTDIMEDNQKIKGGDWFGKD